MSLDRLIKVLVVLVAMAVTGVGCGGFAAAPSISPLFFLLQNAPTGASPLVVATNASTAPTFAQAR